MSNPVMFRGLWVPENEIPRFSEYGLVEGVLDIDTRKTGVAVGHCTSLNTALDIGAHVGSTAFYMAKRFKRVEAFEAIPATFEYLRLNTQSFDNVAIHAVAASDKDQDLYFEYVPSHTQLSHVVEPGETKHFEGDHSAVLGPIPARALDGYSFKDVSFIKIDVEGTERDVVSGLRNTILESRPLILMEQGKNDSKYHDRKADEGTDFLLELGMEIIKDFPFGKDRLFRFPA